jgi:hypothetical protein
MLKYNIEGDIDFYSELSATTETTIQTDHICLITHEQLSDNHVKMICGHLFNYAPLYHDVLNHKTKFNNLESSDGVLGVLEFRCPYCRYKQEGVLPYYPELGLAKINGINCFVPHASIGSKDVELCSYTTSNEYYDPSIPDDICNTKDNKCFTYGSQISVDCADKNSYCSRHKKLMIKKHKMDATIKLRDDKKQAVLLKKLESAAKKTEKQPLAVCIEILKTGPNKGTNCKCNAVEQNLCRRHFNSNKEITI